MALALFIATLAVGNAFVSQDKQLSLKSAGHDFLAFYTAGTFVREGRASELYDLSAVKAFQKTLADEIGIELGDSVAPWWNPPFNAFLFVPFSLVSYSTAWFAWMAANVLAAAGACVLLCRLLPEKCGWKTWGLVPLLVGASLPLIQSLGHGQNTSMSLFLLAAVVTLWRQQRALAAGMVLGLLFYKPQLAALLAIVLVITLGRRAILGVAISGTTLLAINLVALPGTIADFLARVPRNLHYMQAERAYVWDRHVTLTAFWRYLLQGNAVGEAWRLATLLSIAAMLILAGLLLRAIVRGRRSTSHDSIIAATVVATPLLMPFYFDYDLLLLAVPAVLFAGSRVSETSAAGAPMLRARTVLWIALYAWLFVNPQITSMTRINVAVLMLAGLSVMSIIAAARRVKKSDAAEASRATTLGPSQALPLAA